MCLNSTEPVIEFRHIGIHNGLSNSQINVIFKDSRGFVWLGTQSGLDRYDGYRFKSFYYQSTDKKSLPDNWISDIQETYNHKLLIKSPRGYSLYDPFTESFDFDPETFNHRYGLRGTVNFIFIDKHKNWIVSSDGVGVYFIDNKHKPYLFTFGKQLPRGTVTSISEYGKSIILTYDNGILVSIIPSEKRVDWISTFIPRHRQKQTKEDYKTYVSRLNNYWVMANGQIWIYNKILKKWFTDLRQYLLAQNYSGIPESNLLPKAFEEDFQGRLWIGTDHQGLVLLNWKDRSVHQYLYDSSNPTSISDNTIQSLYLDSSGDLWIGTYKNGLSYYSPNAYKYATIPLGDICTIVEDWKGNYWCGTNDKGIIQYNPYTGFIRTFSKRETGLGTDIVVSSTVMPDGSLWFGSYNGGLTCYKDGRWKSYRAAKNMGLKSDDIWALLATPDHRLALGTLGAGVQIFNPATGVFENYNMDNSVITSNFISSLALSRDGRLLVGHSVNYSVLDLKRHKIVNYNEEKSGKRFPSPSFNQIFEDSRGIIWAATSSGVSAYDPRTKQMTVLDYQNGTTGSVACSVIEDRDHNIWLVSDHGVSRLYINRGRDGWEYFTESFNEYDGLQKRQFNFRSILVDHNGNVVVGGQDGINIIPPHKFKSTISHQKALFSGLLLFDHEISVGEKFNGRVVLEQSMNESHSLHLKSADKAFTILLASNEVTLPSTSRFYYHLKGFSKKWLMTQQDHPAVTFTNLSPGTYTLEVRAVSRNGVISNDISSLKIHIAPPLYLTWWALLCYCFALAFSFYYGRKWFLLRQQEKQNRELDNLKLNIFTNVSHEFRTPLALIVSPLETMIKNESDKKKKERLSLVYRNAKRLLELVNQLLDFRKMDSHKQVLELVTGDVIKFVHNIVKGFKDFSSRNISLIFETEVENLPMSFDPDKLQKIVDNLLSNAFKYTPQNGQVKVRMYIKKKHFHNEDALCIDVADTGAGIPDKDKKNIFAPFYQASNHRSTPFGGSGVGLSLVHDFVLMHDGKVTVVDNPGGGTVFSVNLPVRYDASLRPLHSEMDSLAFTDEMGITDKKAEATKNASSKKPEVLLVDDSEDFLLFMTEVLSERYRVRIAHDGQEGCEQVAEREPDIILSDVMMPRMDGNEFCKRIKGNPATSGIPFVMITARLADTQKIEGMTLGADDYLTKPFNLEILFLRIENLLKWHKGISIGEKPLIKPVLTPVEITPLDEQFVKEATKYVEDHLADTDITVEVMAENLNVSRVQLYRRLVSLTGSTPSEFIRQIRLQHAEQLLISGQLSVGEVAYRVGFNNPRYFSKYFSEMYGMPPSQYVKKNENRP